MTGPTSGALRLGVVSDLHYAPSPDPTLAFHNPFDVAGVLGRLRQALAWFARERADAVVVLGDLAEAGDAASIAAVLEVIAAYWDGPVWVVAGNHDRLADDAALDAAIASVGCDRIRALSATGHRLGGVRLAGLDRRLLAWTAAAAAWGDDPLVLVSHHPLLSRAAAFTARGLRYAGDLPGNEALAGLLLARPALTVVINGHLHARDTYAHGAVVQLTVAALVEPPFGATIVELGAQGVGEWGEDRGWTVRRRALSLIGQAAARLPVQLPADEEYVLSPTLGGWVPPGGTARPGPTRT